MRCRLIMYLATHGSDTVDQNVYNKQAGKQNIKIEHKADHFNSTIIARVCFFT